MIHFLSEDIPSLGQDNGPLAIAQGNELALSRQGYDFRSDDQSSGLLPADHDNGIPATGKGNEHPTDSQSSGLLPIDQDKICRWIGAVAASYGKKLGDIHYIFCSDKRILEVNRQFLGHDYYTDIITFDYTEGPRISGDLYISLETVASNAGMLGNSYREELHRVIVHGVLHLCGFKDKQPADEQNMRRQEQKALELWNRMFPANEV